MKLLSQNPGVKDLEKTGERIGGDLEHHAGNYVGRPKVVTMSKTELFPSLGDIVDVHTK